MVKEMTQVHPRKPKKNPRNTRGSNPKHRLWLVMEHKLRR